MIHLFKNSIKNKYLVKSKAVEKYLNIHIILSRVCNTANFYCLSTENLLLLLYAWDKRKTSISNYSVKLFGNG